MSHLPDVIDQLDPKAKAIYDKICAKRGHQWPGLFPFLMHYPELAEKFSEWSAFLRFDAELKPLYREFAILTLAAHLRCAFEFETHVSYAKKAGVPDKVIDQLLRQDFAAIDDPVFKDIHQAIDVFLKLKVMPQDLQDRLVKVMGEHGLIQLSVLIGWYRMISSFVFAYEFPLPPGMKNPF